jgi:two-component system phosphate regulon sensor histidine kinase PhoR
MIAAEIVNKLADGELLDSVINALREPVLVVDKTTRIIAANEAAGLAFARGSEELGRRRLSEAIRDVELHSAVLKSIGNKETVNTQLELLGIDTRNYDTTVSPLDLGGEPHAIIVFYDITRLEKLERVRQEFLSNISHELRTPLTSILAFVETLEDGAIDDKDNNRHFLSVIRRNAERMHALIADILELSLIESGKVSIEKRPVRMAAIVDEIFTSLSSKAVARGIALRNHVASDAQVLADPARLEQMLTNLIDNAIKFNRQDGAVTAELNERGDNLLISVSDTGEGILPEHQLRIFERFFRADRSRAREVGGTGLGLAIVKHLAKLHGGEVSVSSKLTEGSVFSIELPSK